MQVRTGTLKSYTDIFFDLDHTLWDFDKNAGITLKEVYNEYELENRIGQDYALFLEKYLYHNELLWKRYNKGFITAEELKWKRMWRTLLDFEVADEPLARNLSARFLEILPTKKEVFPYAKEILDYLCLKKYKLHIITNGFEKTQLSKLEHSGMRKYFSQIITSESSNSVKPQKEIFEFAVSKAGTEFTKSIMIGDNPDVDIAGAVSAGMDAVLVNHTGIEIPQQATYTVYHLKELENIL